MHSFWASCFNSNKQHDDRNGHEREIMCVPFNGEAPHSFHNLLFCNKYFISLITVESLHVVAEAAYRNACTETCMPPPVCPAAADEQISKPANSSS